MLTLQEEKHLACFDEDNNLYSSYSFTLAQSLDNEDTEKRNETTIEIESF